MWYLKQLEIRGIFLIIVTLYTWLWLLDGKQAGGIFREVIATGTYVKNSIIRFKILKNINPRSQPSSLQTFLSTPNPKLLKIRNGFYHQPAGYYIEIDSDTCKARYSEEFQGRWETPAKILCPQIRWLRASAAHIE